MVRIVCFGDRIGCELMRIRIVILCLRSRGGLITRWAAGDSAFSSVTWSASDSQARLCGVQLVVAGRESAQHLSLRLAWHSRPVDVGS